MRRSGTSLVEILVVIGIIALLAAFLFPVLTSVKEQGHKTNCVSNLHQLAQSIAMYRNDNGGDGTIGDMYAMGLPPFPLTLSLRGTKPLWHCNGSSKPKNLAPDGFPYRYVPAPPGYRTGVVFWKDYVAEKGEGAIVLMDLNHNSPMVSLDSDLTTKFVIGVRLDTSVVQRRKAGDPWIFSWWD